MATKINDAAPAATAAGIVDEFENGLGPFVLAAKATRMPEVFTDATSDRHEILFANSSFLELTGLTSEEALGKPFLDLIVDGTSAVPSFPDAVNPSGRTFWTKCIRPSGPAFDAAILICPVENSDGITEQHFISIVDMTEHGLLNERQLEGRSDLYRHAPGFVAFTQGPEHKFTFTNPAFELLMGHRKLIGLPAAQALPDLAGQGFIDLLDTVYQSGEHYVARGMPARFAGDIVANERTRYLDFVFQPVRDAGGQVTGLFCEGSDVTDGQRRSEEVAKLQAQMLHLARVSAMGTMAATLAHELNQPLAAIANYASGCTNLLKATGIGGGPLQEGLDAISIASNRAGHIIRRLRDTTKATQSHTELFDLAEALFDVVPLVNAGGCDAATIVTPPQISGVVNADKVQIQQVMINLLKNACEAAAQAGCKPVVTLRARREGPKIRVIVEDNGPGVTAEAQKMLFHWTDSVKADGMGLGLSICRTIIERHGGTIGLDRTGPAGTAFSFTLPLVSKPAS
jgi:two-component system sensor kinase FixL